MIAVKKFMAQKSIGYYLFACSCLLALITLIIYAARGGDVLTKLEPAAIVVLVVGIVLNAAMLVKSFTPLQIIPFMLYLTAFAIFMATEITFIGNLINGVDGNTLDAGFVFIAIFGILSVIIGMVACIMDFFKKTI